MISLVLQGKVPASEDALTAAFFDALRYSNASDVLRRVLSHARPFTVGEALPEFDDFEVRLWPSVGGRQPDAVLDLSFRGVVVFRLVVEVKLGADKTGFGAIDQETRSGDQLAYYLLAATDDAAAVGLRCGLLYLSHHGVLPSEALAESAEVLSGCGRAEHAARLFWLSWRDVHESLIEEKSLPPMLADVGLLLESVRMFRFRSFQFGAPLREFGSPHFYAQPVRGDARPSRFQRASPTSSPDDTGAAGYDWPEPLTFGPANFYVRSPG